MKKLAPFLITGLVAQSVFAQSFIDAANPNKAKPTQSQSSVSADYTQSENQRKEETYTVQRPLEYQASFSEADFQNKEWMKEFPFVVVITKTAKGVKKPESIRIYKNQKLVDTDEIQNELASLQKEEEAYYNSLIEDYNNSRLSSSAKEALKKEIELTEKRLTERPILFKQLTQQKKKDGSSVYMVDETTFKVSTGRDKFEKKGENHAQNDSWTVTPTGYFTPQRFSKKHRSEAYSTDWCKGTIGKIFNIQCTYMENAVFFNGPIAMHRAIPGTELILGQKASGGCIRLQGAVADYLYYSILKTEKSFGQYPILTRDGQLTDINSIEESKRPKSAYGALIIVENITAEGQQ